jgi:tripartite motif-containing protein 71
MENNIPVTFQKIIGEGLWRPYGIIADSHHHIWVAEAGRNWVTKMDEDGKHLMSFGKGEGGLFKKTGKLRQPAGVAVDSHGYCYVTDFKLDQILKYDPQGHYIKSFGKHGKGEGQFDHCWCVKCDPDDNLWVVDRDNNRLQKFDPEGNYLAKIGKKQTEFGGGFNRPSDLAFDNDGNIFVVDEHNYRVLKFDRQGNFIFRFGKEGKERGQLSDPRGIAIDASDRIYVTDVYLDVVHVFNIYGRFLFSFAGPIQPGGSFYRPIGITVTKQGMIYISDNRNNRVMVFSVKEANADAEAVMEVEQEK